VSAGGDERLTEEQQRLVDEAADRIRVLLETAQSVAYEAVRGAADEVDWIRRQVLETCGVEIVARPPEEPPAPMDVPLDDLAQLAVRCGSLLAGAALLAPHVRPGSARTVGAVLKADVPVAVGAEALRHLNESRFYAPEGGTS
jgi:hypothetical protein